jgi:hypothetical protein
VLGEATGGVEVVWVVERVLFVEQAQEERGRGLAVDLCGRGWGRHVAFGRACCGSAGALGLSRAGMVFATAGRRNIEAISGDAGIAIA